MRMEELLAELASSWKLPPFPATDGVVRFRTPKGLLIAAEHSVEEPVFFIYAGIGTALNQHKTAVFQRLLATDIFDPSLHKRRFGYEEALDTLILYEPFDELNQTTADFLRRVELFDVKARWWIAEIESLCGRGL